VREALAGEMSALLTLVKLDTIGKAATLSSMVKQVDKLRLIDAKAPEIHVNTETSEALKLDDVIAKAKELLAQGWLGFKSLVIVRRHDAPVTAMMPPEHRYFIYQNLRMQLEAARFAILRADDELYKSSLTTVKEWLDEFVVKDDPAAQAISEELEGLLKANIRPELPDISGSLRLLREKMKVVGLEATAS
jgi:uroporphyrin-3 C-methyltransferase